MEVLILIEVEVGKTDVLLLLVFPFATARTFCSSQVRSEIFRKCLLIERYFCTDMWKKKIGGNHAFFRDN